MFAKHAFIVVLVEMHHNLYLMFSIFRSVSMQWFEYFAALIRTHEGTCPPFLGKYVNYGKRCVTATKLS